MATPISYGIGLSDQQVQAMLNSDVPEVRQQAETYLAAAQQPQKETSFLQRIGNFFFPPAAGAEPDFNVITGEPNITTNQFPFKSMADMAAANELILSQMFSVPSQTNYGNTQSGFATNFPIPRNVTPVNRGIPTIDLSGLPVNMGVANEPDVPQVPQNQGIPFGTTAKNFLTQTVPNVIRSGINMLPGMRFIQGLDKFDTLPYQDRQFIKSRMDGNVPGISVDPRTGLLVDVAGKNVRSLRGNYAETIDKEYEKYEQAIERAKDKYNVGFDGTKFTGANADLANKRNNFNLKAFNFYKNQKADKDFQSRELLDKVKAQVASGATAKIGQALHGGGDGPGGGGGKNIEGSISKGGTDDTPGTPF